MAKKYVRFNYFEVKLVLGKIALEEDLKSVIQEDVTQNYASADLWDMSGFLDHLMTHKNDFRSSYTLGDEIAELEHDSYSFDSRFNLYGFQVAKLRDTNIPSKKKLGKIKEDIMLDDDEYIGEFVSILYDNLYKVVMVQSNLYGLSIKKIEQYLSELRFRYLEDKGNTEQEPFLVRLTPIIDSSKIDLALGADYYRKINIKASDVSLDASMTEDSLISDMRRTLLRTAGVNIEMQISLGSTEKTRSLDETVVRGALEEFKRISPGKRPRIELTMRENEESEIEVINLLEPRMTDRLSIEIEPRTTIAHEYLFDIMKEKYKHKRREVRKVLGIIE